MTLRVSFILYGSAICLFCVSSLAQTSGPSQPGIQDNSFLVEEAYNQGFGVVQHINAFARFWNSKDWVYTFTQEWPVPGERHQLSYTLAAQHAGVFAGSGGGIGDVLLNYRYQLVGGAEATVAFAPRVSVLLSSGDPALGRGIGGTGVQTNLPLSVVLNKKLVSHWNAGATYIPHAQDALRDRASSAGYNFGQSFVWLAKPRFNVLVESVYSASQQVTGPDKTVWARFMCVNPGIRWAYNLKDGLQIVPGVAVPIGVGPSSGERALFLYLSFEHPFRKIPN
jgi:hypothetical protein